MPHLIRIFHFQSLRIARIFDDNSAHFLKIKMATLLAPYNTAMQLGTGKSSCPNHGDTMPLIRRITGFNSFTQQICVNDAVISAKDATIQAKKEPVPDQPVAQDVVYKTSLVDKVTDVTNEMNVGLQRYLAFLIRKVNPNHMVQINAAFSIKYDAFDAKGKVGFLNTSKVKEADVTFLISVKVVNQVIYDHSLIHFQPVEGVNAENFTEVYGDSFVSGMMPRSHSCL